MCSKFNDFDIRSRNLLETLLNRGFSKYRSKNSFKKSVLNHHDVLDIKYSMEKINEFVISHCNLASSMYMGITVLFVFVYVVIFV